MSEYSIWVMEYAYVTQCAVSSVIYGAHNQGIRKLPYCYVVIKSRDRIAMVDVGYNDKEYGHYISSKFGVENWHSPESVLAPCGIRPEDVDDIFITHAHFDHMGNIESFPNAVFHIQERELTKWIWAMSLPDRLRYMMVATDPSDVLRVADLARQGRLRLIDGDKRNVIPGVDLHGAPDTHTYGSQWIHVRNDMQAESSDSWVLAGDLVYVYENIEGTGTDKMYIPVGLALGSTTNLVLTTDDMMKAVDFEMKRLIPVHEERLKEVFPSRTTSSGLRISEICLASGQKSIVS